MNVLDENFPESQREVLRLKRIHTRQIGRDIGHKSMDDKQMLALLHEFARPTFFTLDNDFFRRDWRHEKYSLVWLDVSEVSTADFIIRFLRHPEFNAKAKRMGCVIRVSHSGIYVYRLKEREEQHARWKI